MEWWELLKEAVGTLTLNKMRTGLAVLGIVIGIGSVITLISLGQGSQQSIQNQIQSLGANLLTISPGSQNSGAVRGAAGSAQTLTNTDAEGILTNSAITTILSVSPEYAGRAQVSTGANNANSQITGATPAYADVHKLSMSTGTFISQQQQDGIARVAVLGPTIAGTLFPNLSDPTGQTIRINGQSLTVIGMTVSKGGTGFQNPDNAIYVPLSTAQSQLFGVQYLSDIAVEAKSSDVMVQAQDELGYYLLARHHLTDPTTADFSILSQNDILSTASQVTGTFTTLLGGIAAISLLVGGIGIMNIMLVTVTERTREIGLRKALGAKRKMIITQFLTESIILTITGGVIGMLLGLSLSYILSMVLKIPFAVSLASMFLATGVSGAIGIVFGWYPARQAAALQPIEALRYE
jgi:putative ABC transport system permease protein